MITFTEQAVADIIETELWPLLVEHREALTTNKALMKLAPDVDRYRAIEEAGQGVSVVARDGDRVVGYSVNFVAPHLHYCEVVVGVNDVLWTSPDYRARIGAQLMDETKAACRRRGARLLCWHAKPDTTLDRLMRIAVRRQRARVQDTIYTEEL